MADKPNDDRIMTDEEAVELVGDIEADIAAEEFALQVSNARRKVVALALNLESLYLIHTVEGMDHLTADLPDDYMDSVHEPLDRAVRELAELLKGE